MAYTEDLTYGKSHYANNLYGAPANMADDSLATYCQNMTYIAVNLGSSYKIVWLRVAVHNALALNQEKTSQPYLQGSNNSTNGSDGDWSNIIQLTSDKWATPGSYPGWSVDETFENSISYQWYRLSGLAASNNNVLNEWEMFAEETLTTELQDASLDLAAYYQSIGDLTAFLRAHDGLELWDLKTALEAAGWKIEDLSSWLSAFFQEIKDLGTHLSVQGTHYDDLKSVLAAFFQKLEDIGVDLRTWGTHYDDMPSMLEAAAFAYRDLSSWMATNGEEKQDFHSGFNTGALNIKDVAAYLSATDGVQSIDLASFLFVTDGIVEVDLGMRLQTIDATPAFRAITAQRVASIMHEVS